MVFQYNFGKRAMPTTRADLISAPSRIQIVLECVGLGFLYGLPSGLCVGVVADCLGSIHSIVDDPAHGSFIGYFDNDGVGILLLTVEFGIGIGVILGLLQGAVLASYNRVLHGMRSDADALLKKCRVLSISLSSLLLIVPLGFLLLISDYVYAPAAAIAALTSSWLASARFARWFAREPHNAAVKSIIGSQP